MIGWARIGTQVLIGQPTLHGHELVHHHQVPYSVPSKTKFLVPDLAINLAKYKSHCEIGPESPIKLTKSKTLRETSQRAQSLAYYNVLSPI